MRKLCYLFKLWLRPTCEFCYIKKATNHFGYGGYDGCTKCYNKWKKGD